MEGEGIRIEKFNWNRPVSNPRPTLSGKGRHTGYFELDKSGLESKNMMNLPFLTPPSSQPFVCYVNILLRKIRNQGKTACIYFMRI
jgi:hypothetical protein